MLPDTITVGNASTADIEKMSAISSTSFYKQSVDIPEPIKSRIEGACQDTLRGVFSSLLIAALSDSRKLVLAARNTEGEVLGFAQLSMDTPCPFLYIKQDTTGWAYLEMLFVDQGHPDEKLGNRLVQAITEVCKEKGAEAVWVMEWESDQDALDLYEECGFTQKGDNRSAGEGDAENRLLFVKSLGG